MASDSAGPSDTNSASASDRRSFLSTVPSLVMTGGLVAGYGTCASMGARFLYPARPRAVAWMYVARVDDLAVGDSVSYQAPGGEKVAIARRAAEGAVEDFIALSSTCPHLGCQVHWQALNQRFFCPCHNGAFDAEGTAISGPPADAGQALPRYPLKIEDQLLFIEVPVESLPGPDSKRA